MSNLRKLLVAKDVNYGASKTSATANTALTPDQLADGAIGVYGIHTAGATNVNKLVLITDGGGEAAGKIQAASFVGKEIFFAQGNSYGNLINPPIDLQPSVGVKETRATKYVAPIKGVTVVGYSPAIITGLLQYPATVLRGDLFAIGITNRRYRVAGEREPNAKERYSVEAKAGDTAYQTLVKLVTLVANTDALQRMIDVPVITGNYVGAVFTTSATANVTNGSTAVTTSAAHGVTVNQFIALGGDVYQAIVIPNGSAITLDRPYRGATNAALANAQTNNTGSTSAPTQLGLQITDLNFFADIDVTVQGFSGSAVSTFQGATITKTVFPSTGSGSITMMQALETETKVFKGTSDFITQYIPKDLNYVDTTQTGYDLYFLRVQNFKHGGGDVGSVFRIENHHIFAFVQGVADTAGKNQCDWENIMTTFISTFPQISA